MFSRFIIKNKIFITQALFVLGILFLFLRPVDNRTTLINKMNGGTDPHPELLFRKASSYEDFKRMYDSLQQLKYWKENRLQAGLWDGYDFFIGVSKIYECDSCYQYPSTKDINDKLGFRNKYFIRLKGYTLGWNTFFKIEKDKYIVRNFTWQRKGNLAEGKGQDVETNMRFASGGYPMVETALLVPVSKSTYSFLKLVFYILLGPVLIFLVWSIIVLPSRTLYRISTGKVFVKENITNLKVSGWTMLIMVVLPVVYNLIFQLIMGSRIPKGIYFPVLTYIQENKGWIIAGVALLILAEAFKRGYKLQQEQDLTI